MFSKLTTPQHTQEIRREFITFVTSLTGFDRELECRAIRSKDVRQITGAPHDVFDSLDALNRSGYDIFVTINETDGKDIKGANVTRVRALFADFDGSPLSNLDRIPLKPSFTGEH